MTRPILRGLVALMWTGMCLSGCATVGNPDSVRLLDALRANDARFDNLNLTYTRSENKKIRPDRFQFSKFGDDPSKMPEDYWNHRTVKWTRSCNLVVRGSDAVLSSQFEPSLSEKDRYVTPGAYLKCGNVDGIVYDLSDMQLPDDDPSKNVPNYERQLRITRLRSPMGGLHDYRMAVEFAHGVGFSKRIKNIDSVDAHNNGFRITGDILLWAQDVSRFELEIDNDYLVRKAVIVSNVNGNHTRFEVFTKGTVRQEGLLLAKSGSFRRIWQPSHEQTEKGMQAEVRQAFQVNLNSIELNLSDEQYAQLTEFKINPLMQVDDDVNNIHGTGIKQQDGIVVVEHRPRFCGEPGAGDE